MNLYKLCTSIAEENIRYTKRLWENHSLFILNRHTCTACIICVHIQLKFPSSNAYEVSWRIWVEEATLRAWVTVFNSCTQVWFTPVIGSPASFYGIRRSINNTKTIILFRKNRKPVVYFIINFYLFQLTFFNSMFVYTFRKHFMGYRSSLSLTGWLVINCNITCC